MVSHFHVDDDVTLSMGVEVDFSFKQTHLFNESYNQIEIIPFKVTSTMVLTVYCEQYRPRLLIQIQHIILFLLLLE